MSMHDDLVTTKNYIDTMLDLPAFTVDDPGLNGFLNTIKDLLEDTLTSLLTKFP
jgi:hypothetical protein